jgi:hypothetical protein
LPEAIAPLDNDVTRGLMAMLFEHEELLIFAYRP